MNKIRTIANPVQQFSDKRVAEVEYFDFDFTGDVPNNKDIDTQEVVVTVVSGVDASPSSLLSGSPLVTDTNKKKSVSQLITGGLNGVKYLLTCNITDEDDNAYTRKAYLTVRT